MGYVSLPLSSGYETETVLAMTVVWDSSIPPLASTTEEKTLVPVAQQWYLLLFNWIGHIVISKNLGLHSKRGMIGLDMLSFSFKDSQLYKIVSLIAILWLENHQQQWHVCNELER